MYAISGEDEYFSKSNSFVNKTLGHYAHIWSKINLMTLTMAHIPLGPMINYGQHTQLIMGIKALMLTLN